jgi:biotin transport system substrate-specific component
LTALAQALRSENQTRSQPAIDAALVVVGSLVMALLAQVSVPLPFTPVPVSGQTLGVLLVAGALGSVHGAAAMLLYLIQGAIGLPFFAEGRSGFELLTLSSATGGYLWGFVVGGYVVGRLTEKGWDRYIGSSLGAMLIGEVIIFSFGVIWLAQAVGMTAEEALEAGLYPFIVGDLLKLALAAGALPTAWRIVGEERRHGGNLTRPRR